MKTLIMVCVHAPLISCMHVLCSICVSSLRVGHTIMSKDYQQWLIDYLYLLQDLTAIVYFLRYLEEEKKLDSSSENSRQIIYIKFQYEEILIVISMLCNDMFLSHKESMNDCVSTNTTHSTFQQLRTKRFKKNGLVNCLVTIGSLIALMVECVVILLTTQKKIFKHNSYKEKSVRKKVKQFLTTDYVNVTEVIQIYPLGLVTSPKPKRKAQNQSYNGMLSV